LNIKTPLISDDFPRGGGSRQGAGIIAGPNRLARRYRKHMLEGNKFPDESDVIGRIFPNESLDQNDLNPVIQRLFERLIAHRQDEM
jgi:hypothetical protein